MNKILIANWKMNLNESESLELARQYKKNFKRLRDLDLAVAPSYPYIKEIKDLLRNTNFQLSAQNVSAQARGPFTGEICAEMLSEIGCQYAIAGHSERRLHASETNELINHKLNQCYNHNIIPILCVGETADEKKNNLRDSVLIQQLKKTLAEVRGLPENKLIIAYEPAWAIGMNEFMDPADLAEITRVIKRAVCGLYSENFFDNNVRLLYGGGVNRANAKEFWLSPHIQGLLVAGASLDAGEFYNIALESQ